MSIVQYRRSRAVSADGALDHLARVAEGEKIEVASIAGLGRTLGWSRPRASKALKQWQAAGAVTVDKIDGASWPSRSCRACRPSVPGSVPGNALSVPRNDVPACPGTACRHV